MNSIGRAPAAFAAACVMSLAARSGAAAQQRWTGGPALHWAMPLATMGDYLGGGLGFSLVVRPPAGPFLLETGWQRFGTRTASRPYQGKCCITVDITSSARVFTLLGGAETGFGLSGARLTVGVVGGAAHVQSTGSTVLPGDPDQVLRGGTYTTLTWAAGAHAGVSRRVGQAVVVLEGGVVQLGRADFLREYNLPIGVISGIYLYPTPYAPLFASAGLALRVPL